MYACVVKNDEGTWDIFHFATYGTEQSHPHLVSRQQRLSNAVESGLPITGMVLTPYEHLAMPGAIWDGETFAGGENSSVRADADWSTIGYYGYLCNNEVVYGVLTTKNHPKQLQAEAIWSGETTIVEIPDDQNPKIGDIWDGIKVIKA